MGFFAGESFKKRAGATATRADLWVVGAGVAGAVAARVLADAGVRVAVVAAGIGASHAPVAILNPVRAKRGKPVPEAARALKAARALYSRFDRLFFGLYHRVPERALPKWQENLRGSGLRYRFEKDRLVLPEAFWVRPRRLLPALLAGIPIVRDRVIAWEKDRLILASGRELKGPAVWAAGAEGAALLDPAPTLTAGSLLLVAEPGDGGIQGAFFAGGVLGGSYRSLARYQAWTPTLGEVEELLEKGRGLLGRTPTPLGAFGGVRYRHQEPLREVPGGMIFSGFGSTGFLMAPLFAKKLKKTIL